MFDLKNKVAIVTGAAGGLGEAMASALSRQGAKIAIFDIKEKEGKAVVRKLKTKSKFYKVNLLEEENIIKAIESVKKQFGKIDILINNAGIFYSTPIDSTKKEDWEKIMAVNVTGYFLMAKHTVPQMNKGGKIINISSVAGHHAFPGSAAYNSSKGAVIQLTKTMAMEYAPKGINVNAVCPGIFITPMTKDLSKTKQMKDLIKKSVLLKRPGNADEISGLAVYLSSDESSYMTGSIIDIDGGWTCHL